MYLCRVAPLPSFPLQSHPYYWFLHFALLAPCVPNDEGFTYVKTTVTPSNTETLMAWKREAGKRPDGRKNQWGGGGGTVTAVPFPVSGGTSPSGI